MSMRPGTSVRSGRSITWSASVGERSRRSTAVMRLPSMHDARALEHLAEVDVEDALGMQDGDGRIRAWEVLSTVRVQRSSYSMATSGPDRERLARQHPSLGHLVGRECVVRPHGDRARGHERHARGAVALLARVGRVQ